MNDPYFVGQGVKLRGRLRDEDQVLTTGTVVCRVQTPARSYLTPDVDEVSTGVFEATFTLSQAGIYVWYMYSTGTDAAAKQGKIVVKSLL